MRHDKTLTAKWGHKRNQGSAILMIGNLDLKGDVEAQIDEILKEANLAFVDDVQPATPASPEREEKPAAA